MEVDRERKKRRLKKSKKERGERGDDSQRQQQQLVAQFGATVPAKQRADVRPTPFRIPSGLSPVRDRFLEPRDGPLFDAAVAQCYQGFACESPGSIPPAFHERFMQAFQKLELGGIYQTDVTQPMGLGTKLAPTYVTRTLVGDPGTATAPCCCCC